MIMKMYRSFLFAVCIQLICPCFFNDLFSQKSVPYQYKNVQIVGAGFIDGIIFHPKAKGIRYCRTDMGGAYRWNDSVKKWEPILDWISYNDLNLMGVESLAVDPSDSDKVYLSCGTYTNPQTPNGAVLRSNDRGRTFQRTNMPFKMGGNENGRGNGERMAVDPNNGNIIYLGTRFAGLWKSKNGAISWNKVGSFPDVEEKIDLQDKQAWWKNGSGIVFVIFDSKTGSKGKASSIIYVGVSLLNRDNMFRSNDGGDTWQAIPGQPKQYRPNRAALAGDGNLFISYGTNPGPGKMTDGGVWRFNTINGEWTDITPDKPIPEKKVFGYAAVAVDPSNPNVIITSTFGRPNSAGEEEIFRSTDKGVTWKPVFATGKIFDYSLAQYPSKTPIHWMFDIKIDPFDSNHALFTTGYGGHETFNLTDNDKGKPVKWNIMATGVEESVALDLLSPPKGAALLTAIGDYCGFVHFDLDKPVPEGCNDNPHFGNTNGIACAEKNPDIIVRVGVKSNHLPGTNIGYSTNGGKNWQPTISTPTADSKLGFIAISSDGKTWIWTPNHSPAFLTKDKGTTWFPVKGLPDNTRIVADKVNPKIFYAISLFDGKFYISSNEGEAFIESNLNLPNGIPKLGKYRGDNRGGQDRIYATPGYTGDLWIAAFDGLYHSGNSGTSFEQLPKVSEIHAFGFGKAPKGSKYPALYLIGIVNGTRGIYRSDDSAKTWIRINDDQHQWGLVLHITGDPKKYGRVYIGTHGRGIIYGDPVGK
jgi:hypothetical protein